MLKPNGRRFADTQTIVLKAGGAGRRERTARRRLLRPICSMIVLCHSSTNQDVKLLRVLTDRGSEYCGNPERHEYELYLAVEDIDHSRTKTESPQNSARSARKNV